MSTDFQTAASSGFGALASSFVMDSLASIIVWIIAMSAVIFCDLVTGIARSLREKKEIRFSSACRNTISKICIYFSFVVCACMVQEAIGDDMNIGKYTCIFITLIEFSSICNNILGFHGLALNFNKLFAVIIKKHFEVDTEDAQDIIVNQRRGKNGRFVKKNS